MVPRTAAAGPIPRSWAATATAPTAKVLDGPAWRAAALSLFFAQSDDDDGHGASSIAVEGASGTGRGPYDPHPSPRSRLPSLAEYCLRVLLEHVGTCAESESESESESFLLERLAPYLAPHHRRLAVRLCAVSSPLSAGGLRALWGEPEAGWNQVEGELVIVEPAWSVRPELFRARVLTPVGRGQEGDRGGSGPEAIGERDVAGLGWQEQEEEEEEEQQPLTAIAIVSAVLSIPTLLALPPSLTRLALVHLSAPIPVHRLPNKCPLLEFLDVSFNPWLAEPAWGEERALERVAWGRWAYLKVLGCRDCGITSEEVRKVNEGRWEDVTIVV